METKTLNFKQIVEQVIRGGYMSEINEIVNEVVLFHSNMETILMCPVSEGEATKRMQTSLFLTNRLMKPLNQILFEYLNKDGNLDCIENEMKFVSSNSELSDLRDYRKRWNEMFVFFLLKKDEIEWLPNPKTKELGIIAYDFISDVFDYLEVANEKITTLKPVPDEN